MIFCLLLFLTIFTTQITLKLQFIWLRKCQRLTAQMHKMYKVINLILKSIFMALYRLFSRATLAWADPEPR